MGIWLERHIQDLIVPAEPPRKAKTEQGAVQQIANLLQFHTALRSYW